MLLKKEGLKVGENSVTLYGRVGNHLAELRAVPNSELNGTGNDSCLLGLDSGIPGKLDGLAANVLDYRCGEYTSTCSTCYE